MRNPLKAILPIAACALLLVFAQACASQTPANTEGLTAGELFQRAQDAASQTNYTLAINYYEIAKSRFPEDTEHVAWASYEIAFLYYKMGKYEKSLELFNDLLAQYAANGDNLPPAPKTLAEKVKATIEAKLSQGSAGNASSAAATGAASTTGTSSTTAAQASP